MMLILNHRNYHHYCCGSDGGGGTGNGKRIGAIEGGPSLAGFCSSVAVQAQAPAAPLARVSAGPAEPMAKSEPLQSV